MLLHVATYVQCITFYKYCLLETQLCNDVFIYPFTSPTITFIHNSTSKQKSLFITTPACCCMPHGPWICKLCYHLAKDLFPNNLCFAYCYHNSTDFINFDYQSSCHEAVPSSHPQAEALQLDFNIHLREWLKFSHIDGGVVEAITFSIFDDLEQIFNHNIHILNCHDHSSNTGSVFHLQSIMLQLRTLTLDWFI